MSGDRFFTPLMTKHSEALDPFANDDSDQIDTFDQGILLNKYTSYFKNEDAFGTVLYRICLKLYGEEFSEWDTDTIAMQLSRDYSPVDINLDKIFAVVALVASLKALPGQLHFFNELNCFRHTVNALNGVEPDYEFMGALIPQHIHWAMYELGQMFPEYDLDEEPAKFLGLSYYYIGQMIAPKGLSKYQEFLDYFNKNTILVPKIQAYCDKYWNRDPDEIEENDVLDHQISLLKADDAYINYKKQVYLRDLAQYDSI